MSLLGKLLEAKDPMFTLALKQLEDLTHRHGVDTALIGDMLAKAHGRIRRLKLDPADTTGLELYNSLINLIKLHEKHLAKQLGSNNPSNVAEMVPLIVAKVEQLDLPRNGWFMKETVARKMLKKMPPLQVMKRLGYKNIEDLLETENLYEIYGALRFAEKSEWLNTFIEQYKSLSMKDFENRQIKIVSYDIKKWGNIAEHFIKKKLHTITHLKELGVILLLPVTTKSITGFTLLETAFLLHYLYEVRLYSAFFKLISVKKNFGTKLVDTLIADTAEVSIMNGRHRVHWRVIQRYFGKLRDEQHLEIFEPHVQPEDLHWRKAEEIMYDIDPELDFWQDMDYVALELKGELVTFNLMDMVVSYSSGMKYPDRYLYHFRESLWNEVFVRYMGQRVLEREILQQLDNELIAPEKIKAGN